VNRTLFNDLEMSFTKYILKGGFMKKCNVLLKAGLFLLLMSLAMSGVAFGQTDPRGAMPAPVGTAGLLTYYRHIEGHNQFDNNGNIVSKDYNYTANISMLRPLYYGNVFGIDYLANLIVPFGDKQVTKPGVIDQRATGIGDPQIIVGFWPLKNREKGLYLMPNLYVTAPLGDYQNDRAVNMGANRWAVKPELNFTWRLKDWCMELQANVEFYSENSNYGASGKVSKKDPVAYITTHVTYDINKSIWVGVSGWWGWGGRTTNNDVISTDEMSTGTGMLSFNYKITDNWSILANYARDFQVQNGPAVDQTRLRLAYVW